MATILVIEDNKSLAQMYAFALHSNNAGHHVRLAYTGEEGVEYALKHSPDLVVLDLMLPDISGMKVAQILEEEGVFPGTPLIVASALGDMAQVFQCTLNATTYLTKPFSAEVLLSAVLEALPSDKFPHI